MADALLVWSDLHPDLKIGGSGQIVIVENVEAVYASVNNILLTIMGERVMLRTFAMNFLSILFEPINEDIMKFKFVQRFKQAIEQWEPRVKIEYLDFNSDRDNQTVYIRMEMYIRGYAQVFTFERVYEI